MENNEQGEWAVIIRNGTCSKDQYRLDVLPDYNLMNAKKWKGKVLHMRGKKYSLVMQVRAVYMAHISTENDVGF